MLHIKSQLDLNPTRTATLYRWSMETLGKRIIKLRRANNLSQEALGELCGVSKSAVSQWESDSTLPDLDTLRRLRAKLLFSLDWLLTGEGDMGSTERTPIQELMRVAQGLPDYAVIKLTSEGGTYSDLIERATKNKPANGE